MNLDEAIEKWAKKVAKQYEEHGKPEGDLPERWCNDALLDSILEESDVCGAVRSMIEAAFLKAVADAAFGPSVNRVDAASNDCAR
jgi:hypothetical protein